MYTYKAKITRVVDGDTVEALVDLGFETSIKQTLRLYGIDAPETRTRDLAEKERGNAARDYLAAILVELKGDVIVETVKDRKGSFGRYLAILKGPDERDLNLELVQMGFAKFKDY